MHNKEVALCATERSMSFLRDRCSSSGPVGGEQALLTLAFGGVVGPVPTASTMPTGSAEEKLAAFLSGSSEPTPEKMVLFGVSG